MDSFDFTQCGNNYNIYKYTTDSGYECRSEFLSDCFVNVANMLKKNVHDEVLQSNLERYLFDRQMDFTRENLLKMSISFGEKSSKFIF